MMVLPNETDIVDRLIERKITLKEYEFKKDKLIDIQKKFEVLVSSNPALNSLAVDAYKSYIFVSYFYLIYSHICIAR